MFSELLTTVSTKLNIPNFQLLDSERCHRIIKHYSTWVLRHNGGFQFAVERACHDICSRNGPTSDRKEPRL